MHIPVAIGAADFIHPSLPHVFSGSLAYVQIPAKSYRNDEEVKATD